MGESYRFLNTPPLSAPMNMALDEAILISHLRGEVPPTLRVFRWEQPSISLGRFQNAEREMRIEECEKRGVALVRRPTGGRAVYHPDDFTYSIVIGKQYGVPGGVVSAYAYLLRGLMEALKGLGLPCEISNEHVSKNPSAACFASTTQADLVCEGYKLVGSAQVWRDDVLLQQGSIPLRDRAADFFELIAFKSQEQREKALTEYLEKSTALSTFIPEPDWNQVAEAFQRGFSSMLQHPFEPAEVSEAEWRLAEKLVKEKYSRLIWQQERVQIV